MDDYISFPNVHMAIHNRLPVDEIHTTRSDMSKLQAYSPGPYHTRLRIIIRASDP